MNIVMAMNTVTKSISLYHIIKINKAQKPITLEVVLVGIRSIHQPRRAAYTSDKVLLSLFKVVWLRWMCQLSSMHQGWYAGAGLVPPICLDPLHDQSPAHAPPEQILGCLLFSSLVSAHSLAASTRDLRRTSDLQPRFIFSY